MCLTLEREIKDKGDIFSLEEQDDNFVAAVGKIRNASGHQCCACVLNQPTHKIQPIEAK